MDRDKIHNEIKSSTTSHRATTLRYSSSSIPMNTSKSLKSCQTSEMKRTDSGQRKKRNATENDNNGCHRCVTMQQQLNSTMDRAIRDNENTHVVASTSNKKLKYNENSSSNEDDDKLLIPSCSGVKKSAYIISPNRGLLSKDANLNSFIHDIAKNFSKKRPMAASVLHRADDMRDSKIKFNNIPMTRTYFAQFNYERPMRFVIVSNMYGANVNTADAYNNRQELSNVKELKREHRVTMFLPSVENWWHEPSKNLMREFTNKFVNDIKGLGTTDAFREAATKFRLLTPGDNLNKLRDSILNCTRQTNDGLAPGTFKVIIPNTPTMPSKIDIPLGEVYSDTKYVDGKWKNLLLDASYIHGLAVINVSGFKITKSGFFPHMAMEFLCYSKVTDEELQQFDEKNNKDLEKNIMVNSKWYKAGNNKDEDEDSLMEDD